MGLFLSRFWESLSSLPDVRVCMVGLDAAGKTTVLYKLKLNETVTTIPTIGFNVERVEYKSLCFTVWDIGGQDKIRSLWKHYYSGSDAIIYVVDSADQERLQEAREVLHSMLADEDLRGAALLVFANKQDLPQALPTSEVASRLDLPSIRGREWLIQSTVAASGEGLYEGLDWLSSTIRKLRANPSWRKA